MKVLFVTRKYPPMVGGMEQFSYQLIRHYEKVHDSQDQVDSLVLGKKQIHLLWFFPYVVFRLLFTSLSYDVVHLGDGLIAGAAWLPMKLQKIFFPRRRPQYYATLHGLDITYIQKFYQYYFKGFCRSLDTYICISSHTMMSARLAGINNTVLIPNGVDVSTCNDVSIQSRDKSILQKRFSLDPEARILLSVGRLVKRKGVLWFLQNVFPLLSSNCFYFIVGQGPMEGILREYVDNLDESLKRRIVIAGRISDNDLKLFYNTADVFIMPNISVPGDMEGFGLVALEASLHGLLVFASKLEGIQDAIEDQKNGFLLDSEHTESWVAPLNHYLCFSDKYEGKRLAFSSFTKNHCSWERVTRNYRDAFKRLSQE